MVSAARCASQQCPGDFRILLCRARLQGLGFAMHVLGGLVVAILQP